MFIHILFLNLLLFRYNAICKRDENDLKDLDEALELITQMKNDENLDLNKDEEYEDLRAEMLAYHSALASLSSPSRRSMATTPCWQVNGICIHYKLCSGFKYITEVPGCKDKYKVCCFTWNRYRVHDLSGLGIESLGLPWSPHLEFGGKGVVSVESGESKKKRTEKEKREKEGNERKESENAKGLHKKSDELSIFKQSMSRGQY